MTPNQRLRQRLDARVRAERDIRISARCVVGEDLVWHRPAVVVHRGLIARAIGDELIRIGGGVWGTDEDSRRDKARRKDPPHSPTVRRVIP